MGPEVSLWDLVLSFIMWIPLNSGHWGWWQVTFPAEPLLDPNDSFFEPLLGNLCMFGNLDEKWEFDSFLFVPDFLGVPNQQIPRK